MIILITFVPDKNFKNMTHHTESRHAGSVPGTAAATGTFGNCKAGEILAKTLLLCKIYKRIKT
jgi:hypothetical protein